MKAIQTAVTLKDIAEKSGVSITTASRILDKHESGIPIRLRLAGYGSQVV